MLWSKFILALLLKRTRISSRFVVSVPICKRKYGFVILARLVAWTAIIKAGPVTCEVDFAVSLNISLAVAALSVTKNPWPLAIMLVALLVPTPPPPLIYA